MTGLDQSGFEYDGFNEAPYNPAATRYLQRYCRFFLKKLGRAAGRRFSKR